MKDKNLNFISKDKQKNLFSQLIPIFLGMINLDNLLYIKKTIPIS